MTVFCQLSSEVLPSFLFFSGELFVCLVNSSKTSHVEVNVRMDLLEMRIAAMSLDCRTHPQVDAPVDVDDLDADGVDAGGVDADKKNDDEIFEEGEDKIEAPQHPDIPCARQLWVDGPEHRRQR